MVHSRRDRRERSAGSLNGSGKETRDNHHRCNDADPQWDRTDACRPDAGLPSRFIILSAYNEFTYVKQALKLGAVDYILKLDIEPDVLLEAVEKAKDSLPELKHSSASFVTWKDKANCIKQLLQGSDPKAALESCDLKIPEKNLICIYSKDILSPNELLQVGFYPDIQTIVMHPQ